MSGDGTQQAEMAEVVAPVLAATVSNVGAAGTPIKPSAPAFSPADPKGKPQYRPQHGLS